MKVNFIENPYSTFWIEGDIMYNKFKPRLNMDLGIAKECAKSSFQLTKGKKIPMMVNLENLASIDKEARDFMANPESTFIVKASALVVKSKVQRVMVTIFLNFSRPAFPVMLFSSEMEAFDWLQKFL